MKSLLIIGFLFLSALEASPYYRFWRGYKKEEFSQVDFIKAIAKTFVPATIEAGAGQGLAAYLPAIPTLQPDVRLPDEIALVVYESKEKYDAFKATEIGKAYSDLHWQYFVRAPLDTTQATPAFVSKSTVPEYFNATALALEVGKAYDVLATAESAPPQWQKGMVRARFFKRTNLEMEIAFLKGVQKNFSQELAAYLVLVDENYLLTYELWKDDSAITAGLSKLAVDSGLELYKGNNLAILETDNGLAGMQNLELKAGRGFNAQFNTQETAVYLDNKDDKLTQYASDVAKKRYGKFLLKQSDEFERSGTSVKILKSVIANDPHIQGRLQMAFLEFSFKETLFCADGKTLVINNGNVAW